VDAISLGVLTRTYPLAKIKAVLEASHRTSIRNRALPAQVTVYFVLAMALCMDMASREVLRWLLEGIRWLLAPKDYGVTVKSGITQARQRLGWEPLKRLHDEMVKPIAQNKTRGAWYRQWRLVSLDGSTLSVADTPENEQAWGRAGCGRGKAGYPSLRFVSLVENGTHVLFASQLGHYCDAEVTLAQEVVKALRAGMLCLADRGFLGWKLWNSARSQGADLLWRAKRAPRLDCAQRLADGSYLSYLYASQNDRRKHTHGQLVRVIEYWLEGVAGSERCYYRLVTTILDPEQAPARELAALYHERWEIETTLDEFKTHLRGARVVLRSKTPDLVRQEFYGFLLTHFAIRGLMHEAALSVDEDPDRLSFLHAVRVIRRKVVSFVISPQGRTRRVIPSGSARNSRATGRKQPWPTHSPWSEAHENQVSTSSTQEVLNCQN
jgi:hypothetical protein